MRRNRRRGSANRTLKIMAGILAILLILSVAVGISAGKGKPSTSSGSSNSGTSGKEPTVTIQELTVTSPGEQQFVTVEKTLVFEGTAQPGEQLTVGGQTVTVDAEGRFRHEMELAAGENEILLTYDGETVVYLVEYRYATEFYSPAGDRTYGSGGTVCFSVSAREGSQVQAELAGSVISLTVAANQLGSGVSQGFVLYTGSLNLPEGNSADRDLGCVTYTVSCDGITETYTSGQIRCSAAGGILTSNPSVTPNYGEYIDVGSGYIAEVITYQAETFDGKTTDDNSSPLRNYLPEGTVDYASTQVVKNSSASYMLLRCGRRVYVEKTNYPSTGNTVVVDCYMGTLPDHNEIGFVSMEEEEHFTVLTLDVLWKAPFYFDLKPQSYNNISTRDFRVSEVTAEYVDITFCYATVFDGTVTIPADNPLFRSAELTQNESDCTLRLYLKNVGCFYGWDAYYNEADQLCFRFLNPLKVESASNSYGADLTGIRIMIDVGHGGVDGGSATTNASGKQVEESDLNLALALILREELESMGATVIMNREDDSRITVDERIMMLKEAQPDLCIAIHQDAYPTDSSVNGARVCYATPFSQPLAKRIYENTLNAGIYQKVSQKWHYYYVARQTDCPVVLLENGFMSNPQELAGMQDETVLLQKSQAMAQAVADYFLQMPE